MIEAIVTIIFVFACLFFLVLGAVGLVLFDLLYDRRKFREQQDRIQRLRRVSRRRVEWPETALKHMDSAGKHLDNAIRKAGKK